MRSAQKATPNPQRNQNATVHSPAQASMHRLSLLSQFQQHAMASLSQWQSCHAGP
jgi:hypothetical protein